MGLPNTDMLIGLKSQLLACIDEMKYYRDSKSVGSTQNNELIDQIDTEKDLLLRAENIMRNIECEMCAQPGMIEEFAFGLTVNCARMRKRLGEKKGGLEGAGTNEPDAIPCDLAEPEMSFDELVSGMDRLYGALSSTLTECVYDEPKSLARFFS